MERLKRIIIGGKNYPIKMDLNVLERIQDVYGSVNRFEMDILGYVYQRDESGAVKKDEEGSPLIFQKEPSIHAIKTVLPLMINEGLAIEADEQGRAWEAVSDKEVFRECTVSFELLAKMIHDEYRKCFAIKKSDPEETQEKMSR